jgi:hypothetical protein
MSDRKPLFIGWYVAGVIVVLAIVLPVTDAIHGPVAFGNVSVFAGGFLTGMAAMFIATRLYRTRLNS